MDYEQVAASLYDGGWRTEDAAESSHLKWLWKVCSDNRKQGRRTPWKK